MDPVKNPYVPGAGNPPPELAGRSAINSLIALRASSSFTPFGSTIPQASGSQVAGLDRALEIIGHEMSLTRAALIEQVSCSS